MNLDPKKIKSALDTSQNLREIYFNFYHGEKPCISVNDLLKIVKNDLGKNITLSFHDDDYKDHSMYSFVAEIDGSFEICLMSGMSNCWNRFALCKELFHVVLDAEDARNSLLASHLLDYRSSMTDRSVEGNESSKNEVLTEFAAMQFIFPYQRRIECIKEIESRSGESKKALYEEIAIRYRIPRLLIEDYLQVYMDLFDSISWNEKSDRRI